MRPPHWNFPSRQRCQGRLSLSAISGLVFGLCVVSSGGAAGEGAEWEIAYHLSFPVPKSRELQPVDGELHELPGFSVLPPAADGWMLMGTKAASHRLFSRTPPKKIKKLKHSLMATAQGVLGGESFGSTEALEQRLRTFTEEGSPLFEFVEIRGPERTDHIGDCVRLGLTQMDHRQLPKMPSPLETTVDVLDCRHPENKSYHVVLTYTERRPPGNKPLAEPADMEAYFDSLQFTDLEYMPAADRWVPQGRPVWVHADEEIVWLTLTEPNSLLRLVPDNGEVAAEFSFRSVPGNLAVGAGAVWVPTRDGLVTRIDPARNEIVARIRVPNEPFEIATGADAIWVLDGTDLRVSRIDPETDSVVSQISLDEIGAQAGGSRSSGRKSRRRNLPPGLVGLQFWEGSLWVGHPVAGTIYRIDPHTDTVAGPPIKVGKGPVDLMVAEGALWTVNHEAGSLSRLDPVSKSVQATITVGAGPTAAVADARWIWVVCHKDSSLVRIDPTTNRRIGAPIPIGGGPTGLALGRESLWVTTYLVNSLVRLRLTNDVRPE